MTRQASKCVFQICYTLIKESTRSRITGDTQILFFLVSIKLNHENLWHNFTSFMFKYILTCRVSSLPRQVLKVSVTPQKCPPLDLKVGTPLPLKKKKMHKEQVYVIGLSRRDNFQGYHQNNSLTDSRNIISKQTFLKKLNRSSIFKDYLAQFPASAVKYLTFFHKKIQS